MTLLMSVDAHSQARRLETSDGHKAELGQYFTGEAIAAFMAGLATIPVGPAVRILDPGAGTGILGIAAAARALELGAERVFLTAVERDKEVVSRLRSALELLQQRFPNRVDVQVIPEDFLALAEAPLLGGLSGRVFDLIIANPPYFKMSPSVPLGGDAPNAYARFMDVSAGLLRDGGQMIFIVPRSFASGLYFRRFRDRLHGRVGLERVHVFGSRRSSFSEDEVLQENVIVSYRRGPWPSQILMSESAGPQGLAEVRVRPVNASFVRAGQGSDGTLAFPTTPEDESVIQAVRGWTSSLDALGLTISTGPVVPFRTDALCQGPEEGAAPLLWMQHVRAGAVSWPLPGGFRKPEYIRVTAGAALLVANRTYVLMRRFSAKEEARRLTLAVLEAGQLPGPWVGLENHLNFIHAGALDVDLDLAHGVAAVLSSVRVDRYFRLVNGNTQVNATDLRALPLPGPSALAALGRAVRLLDPANPARQERIDALVEGLSDAPPTPTRRRRSA